MWWKLNGKLTSISSSCFHGNLLSLFIMELTTLLTPYWTVDKKKSALSLVRMTMTIWYKSMTWQCDTNCHGSRLSPSAHTTPKEFVNSVSLWRLVKCFQSTPCRRNLKTQHFRSFWIFVLEENSGRKITWLSRGQRFRKALFFKRVPPALKRFQKGPFLWRISVEGRPNCRNKTASSNSSRVAWTRP